MSSLIWNVLLFMNAPMACAYISVVDNMVYMGRKNMKQGYITSLMTILECTHDVLVS